MRACGIILAGGKSSALNPFSKYRATAAFPVAADFRAVDFSLSNLTNSGIKKVAVIAQYNSRAISDHLNSSKWWNIGRKSGGLFVFTPYSNDGGTGYFSGTADSMYKNISFLERSHTEFVIITNGDCVYKMDYNKILNEHINNDADITVVTKEVEGIDLTMYGNVAVNDKNRIIEFEEKPLEPFSNRISLGIYAIRRELLIDLLKKAHEESRYDFVQDIIIRYRKLLNIYSYDFQEYWKPINSIQSYYNVNMDFLDSEVRNTFFNKGNAILTKNKDEPPAKFNYMAEVGNSLVGDGSIVSGMVYDSIIFRNVKVGSNSILKSSVVCENVQVGQGCYIEYAIIDKGVVIGDGVRIVGDIDNIVTIEKNRVISEY